MLFKLARNNISRKKTKSLLAVIGIAVAIFVLRISTGLVTAIEERALEPVRIIYGADVFIIPPNAAIVEEKPGSYNLIFGDERGDYFLEPQPLKENLARMGIKNTYPMLFVKCYLLDNNEMNILVGRDIEKDTTIFHIDERTQGRYFTEVDNGKNVAVIDISNKQWSEAHIRVGDTLKILLPRILIENERLVLDFGSGTVKDFEIIGLYSGGLFSTSTIWVPAQTLQQYAGIDKATYMAIITDGPRDAEKVKAKVEQDLAVTAITMSDVMSMISKDFAEFRQFIRTRVIITYFVSALVLVNVMLASIHERRHEIGILKSIGAKTMDIVVMTVYESALLGLGGGLIGFFCGNLTVAALTGILFFDTGTAIADIGIVIIVCSIAGLYPAVKASRVPALEVLRYE